MKLLLDENLPHQLRMELPGHDVFTTAYMGWSGVENGQLLQLAADNGFNALITNDRGLEYQQNPLELPVAVVVLLPKANTIERIRLLIPRLLSQLTQMSPGQFAKIHDG